MSTRQFQCQFMSFPTYSTWPTPLDHSEPKEAIQMHGSHSRPYVVELYAVLPSAFALVAVTISRTSEIAYAIQILLIGLLATGAFVAFRNVGLILVILASVLDKTV